MLGVICHLRKIDYAESEQGLIGSPCLGKVFVRWIVWVLGDSLKQQGNVPRTAWNNKKVRRAWVDLFKHP